MNKTIDLSLRIRPFNVLYTRMIPLPDVEIFQHALNQNQVTTDTWYKYMRGEIELPVYLPEGVNRKQLDKVYKKAYLKFYLSPRTLFNYLPLFTDIKFFFNSVKIFLSLSLGKVKFK